MLDFQQLEILTSGPVSRPNMRHRTKFREDRSNRSRDIADLRLSNWAAVRHPPSWICLTRVGTTHEEYLVVFVSVLNLIVIGAVLSIVCKF